MIANAPNHDSDFALLDAIFLDGRPVEGLSSQELIPWFNQPHIQSAISQLKTISETVVALRHARARFTAIESLEQLSDSAPNPTDRLRAAIALLRPPPSRGEGRGGVDRATKTTAPSTEPPTTPTPHIRQHPAHHSQGQGTNILELKPPLPDLEGVQSSSRRQSKESSTRAAHGATPTNLPDPERAEPSHPSILDVLADLEDQYNDDLADAEANLDDAEDPDAALDAAEDAASDRHAAAVEAHLGVPITHPEILKAITELRIHDLDAIAARIRAETRASASGPAPDH